MNFIRVTPTQSMGMPSTPAIYFSEDLSKLKELKNELEIERLKSIPIAFNFDYMEENCSSEMIKLNNYLFENFNCRFLARNFELGEEVNHSDIDLIYFPSEINDQELLFMQSLIGNYHYKLIEDSPKDKIVMVFNPICFDQVTTNLQVYFMEYFDSIEKVNQKIFPKLSNYFDRNGTYDFIDRIRTTEMTDEFNKQIEDFFEFKIEIVNDVEVIIKSEMKLEEITNGQEKLFQILDTINRRPFQLVKT